MMSTQRKLLGATLAAAVALSFTVLPLTSAFAADTAGQVKCMGSNQCKGQSACKTANNACKGQNSCKGKGLTMEASKEQCEKAGGKMEEAAK